MKSQIAETINNWFEETFRQIQENAKPVRQLDLLTAGILICAWKYSKVILTLLDSGHKLPAQALLRILCELHIKSYWCLKVPDKDRTDSEKETYERFTRWDYLSFVKQRGVLKRTQEVSSGDFGREVDKALTEVEERIATYKNRKLRCMPDTRGLFEELPQGYNTDVYPKVYARFSRAVHLDMKTIRDLARCIDNLKVD